MHVKDHMQSVCHFIPASKETKKYIQCATEQEEYSGHD